MATYVVSWCIEGLEGIIPFSELEANEMWEILKGNKVSETQRAAKAVNMMVLRAKFNTHRHYEIYAIETSEGITDKELRTLFEENPQYAADLLRERGTKIYSDRQKNKVQVIY